VDAAKGVGILLVVLGHNQVNSYVHGLHALIYSFHMPLFFLLAGMFMRPERGFWELATRRFFSILRPYLFILVMIYLMHLIFSPLSIPVVLLRLLKALFYALPNYYEMWMPLWFLPHLFVLSLFAWAIARLIYERLPFLWLRALFLLGLLFCGVLVMNLAYKTNFTLFDKLVIEGRFPWSIDLLLTTGAFFLAGYEVRRSLPDAILSSKWTLVISAAVWVGLCIVYPSRLDLASRRYGLFPIVTLEVISGCLLIFSLCRHLEWRGGKVFHSLSTLGRYSIVILIFHGPIQSAAFYKGLSLLPSNPYLAAALAFLAAVGIPVLLCELILRGNPRIAEWFGLSFAQEKAIAHENLRSHTPA